MVSVHGSDPMAGDTQAVHYIFREIVVRVIGAKGTGPILVGFGRKIK